MSGAKVDVMAAFDMCIECFGAAEECPDDTACIEEIKQARAAVAELIEADRWRDPIAEPAEHRQRVLVAYEMGRHVVVGSAVRWLHTPGDHDGDDEWELGDSDYVVKVLAWRPMPEFDRAALARVQGDFA